MIKIMKMVLFPFLLMLISASANSQWKKLADFIGTDGSLFTGEEYITCVYFVDLPGPPRIGFVGTESELHKTTDGGKTWYSVWNNGKSYTNVRVEDICFKDSLIGWFCADGYGLYRTMDGGETWEKIPFLNGSTVNGYSLYYNSFNGRLFMGVDTALVVSTNLGQTWQGCIPYEVGQMSFSSDSTGIAAAYFSSYAGLIFTSNGGLTWVIADTTSDCKQPLAITGSPICFEIDGGWNMIVRRSDDYGHTWRQVADLTGDSSHYGTGIIQGNLSRLYVQTDSGMYVSLDSGSTWQFDGGPAYLNHFTNDLFYSANGVTIAGSTYLEGGIGGMLNGNGLWEEIWPTSGVAAGSNAENHSQDNSITVWPDPASGEITVNGAAGAIAIYDPLGREHPVSRNGNTVTVSSLVPGIYFVGDGVHRTKFVKE